MRLKDLTKRQELDMERWLSQVAILSEEAADHARIANSMKDDIAKYLYQINKLTEKAQK